MRAYFLAVALLGHGLVFGMESAGRVRLADIHVQGHAGFVQIETDAVPAQIRKKGYVSGLAAGSFRDKQTGARDASWATGITKGISG
jgi:hypothetical protein